MIDSIVQASARSGTPSQLLQGITGHPSYLTGPANAKALSVVSFEAVERLGEPYRIVIELTHPEALAREDYLGRDARSRSRRAQPMDSPIVQARPCRAPSAAASPASRRSRPRATSAPTVSWSRRTSRGSA